MTSKLIDTEELLSENEHWTQLEEKWGTPIDLETEDDTSPKANDFMFSTLDLRKTTFDSSFLFKKIRKNAGRNMSKVSSSLDYMNFLRDLQNVPKDVQNQKEFYFINGQIISAFSVEEICHKIDEVFKSIDKLNSATSTVRGRKTKRKLPDKIECSINISDLSYDDTNQGDCENNCDDLNNVDRYLDDVFEKLDNTLASVSKVGDRSFKDSVTTLVNRFSSYLKSPEVRCSPRKKRKCCDKFKELAEFWESQAFSSSAIV